MNTLTLDQQFFTALVHADTAALERILSDDFMLIDVNSGSEIAKPDLLTALGLGHVKFESIEPSEQRVRRYQTTVVITGRTRMTGRLGVEPFSTSSRYTHVYVEQQGAFRMVAAQGTQMSPGSEAR
ncbi:MAG: nuclear transport factor 2 family protein [Vicinamibacteria bacterium]